MLCSLWELRGHTSLSACQSHACHRAPRATQVYCTVGLYTHSDTLDNQPSHSVCLSVCVSGWLWTTTACSPTASRCVAAALAYVDEQMRSTIWAI